MPATPLTTEALAALERIGCPVSTTDGFWCPRDAGPAAFVPWQQFAAGGCGEYTTAGPHHDPAAAALATNADPRQPHG